MTILFHVHFKTGLNPVYVVADSFDDAVGKVKKEVSSVYGTVPVISEVKQVASLVGSCSTSHYDKLSKLVL